MLQKYCKDAVKLPVGAWMNRFRIGGKYLPPFAQRMILQYLGQPVTGTVRNCDGPSNIIFSRIIDNRPGKSFEVILRGTDIDEDAHTAMLRGSAASPYNGTTFHEATGTLPPQQHADGGYEVFHCASVAAGLRILCEGRLGMSRFTRHCPNGVYSAATPAHFYDLGCTITLRIAGIFASRAAVKSLIRDNLDVPVGLICVMNRSVRVYAFHPRSSQVVKMTFHMDVLMQVIRSSPIALWMDIPQM